VDDSALGFQAVPSGRSLDMNRVTDFYSQQQQTVTSADAPTTAQIGGWPWATARSDPSPPKWGVYGIEVADFL